MSQRHHFQVIILGDSLASRLAGVMLAKAGTRVLTFTGGTSVLPPWFHSSQHLERILESLDGHSCFAPPVPFQVISPSHRLECHGATPLEEELRREFPREHEEVGRLLQRLTNLGERLEALLWKQSVLPNAAFTAGLRFACRGLLQGLRGRELSRPLSSLFAPLAPAGAGEVLRALFAAVALAPVEHLSVAEGALLWSGICRSRSVSPSGLETLLRHRYDQFHGETERLENIKEIHGKGSRLTEVVLQNDWRFGGERFIIGTPQGLPQLPAAARRRCPTPSPEPGSVSLSAKAEQVSPLLAPRVILTGEPPLRISFTRRENQVLGRIDAVPLPGAEPLELELLRERLRVILPFAEFELKASLPSELSEEAPPRRGFLGTAARQRLGGNLLYCHGAAQFPSLGATGEILAGRSAAVVLQRRKG